MSVDIGQSAVHALMAYGELFVIDSEQVEQGGMEVVTPYGLLRFPAPFI